ncbi:MAG: pseudouridine synthase [Thiopseudomonas sp.]|nr:pseudouridine synthase [Thiopseudomonas sp.]
MKPAGASRVVVPSSSPQRLLDFLCQRFSRIPAPLWQQRLQQGKVLDAQLQPLMADSVCHAGQVIYYFRELAHEVEVPFVEHVLFENEQLLVIDKPHFLAVSPVGGYVEQTVLRRLQTRFELPELTPVHRLDRLTAGVLLLCKTAQHRDTYQALFRQQQVVKEYEALAAPLPQLSLPHIRRSRMQADAQHFFRSCEVAGEANSETRIDVLHQHAHHWHYRLQPTSGRKHQLRVHMAALGAPIIGDDFYPQPLRRAADDFSQPLQLLARRLAFTDPLSGHPLTFVSLRELVLPASIAAE